jgi:hypothetical protein
MLINYIRVIKVVAALDIDIGMIKSDRLQTTWIPERNYMCIL